MSIDVLTIDERKHLLDLARRSVRAAAAREPLPPIDPALQPPRLWDPGASFVTLTESDGSLRGCIGTLEAYQPLVLDVCTRAAAAAVEDYRFDPVRPEEVDRLKIEISRLTMPAPLAYHDGADLVAKLRPGLDGVILRDGSRRATFLPQVWEKLPRAEDFLGQLCRKMGAPAELWKSKHLVVLVYQVEEFHD
jgi:AmmeMemoRadiSam system protein A